MATKTPPTEYYVRGAPGMDGAIERDQILQLLAEGELRLDMEFSPDGSEWERGTSIPDLYETLLERREQEDRADAERESEAAQSAGPDPTAMVIWAVVALCLLFAVLIALYSA